VSKPVLLVLGAALVVMGVVFTLQGLGYLDSGPMAGVTFWAVVGPILALIGLALVYEGARSRRNR
jgi:energy-converting hydrogenase Eha subunit C